MEKLSINGQEGPKAPKDQVIDVDSLQVLAFGSSSKIYTIPSKPYIVLKQGQSAESTIREFELSRHVHTELAKVSTCINRMFACFWMPELQKPCSDHCNIASSELELDERICQGCHEVTATDFTILPEIPKLGSIYWNIPAPESKIDDPTCQATRQTMALAFAVQRIPSIPIALRAHLIDIYIDSSGLENAEILATTEHTDCLAHIYSGMTSPRATSGSKKAPLRTETSLFNFPLYLDRSISAELDPVYVVVSMAVGMAALHFAAEIDGADCEFVLGGLNAGDEEQIERQQAQQPSSAPTAVQRLSLLPNETKIYILDFDKCSRIRMDDDGVKRAAAAIKSNGPHFPMPPSKLPNATDEWDEGMWLFFRVSYITAGTGILQFRNLKNEETLKLPEKVIEEVESLVEEERRLDLEDGVIFTS